MTARVRLPRLLSDSAGVPARQEVDGSTLAEALEDLFARNPGVRHHILDEEGRIRRHLLVFVDAGRADLETPVTPGAEIQVLQAVSGG